MDIKTVPQPPYSPDLAPCNFWLFPKLRGCRYETIEEMKEAVTKVIDTLTQEDLHGVFQKLLERYNKCIAAGGDYFEGYWSFMSVLSIKDPIRKKSWNLFNDPLMWPYSWCFVGCCLKTWSVAEFVWSSCITFFSCILLVAMWCIHIVVWIPQQLGRNPVLFHRIDEISKWSVGWVEYSMPSLCVYWHLSWWDFTAEVILGVCYLKLR